ncbi:hypothetical protein H0H93_012904 [Arthromyces matolae]|nr:hypothetical protein H0H93_012904 [Arthromyces matolae]
MGASQSKSDGNEHVFINDTPISFSPEVVDQLSDRLESSGTPVNQQSILDAHVRSRIQDEIENLKLQEETIRQEIDLVLQEESLGGEKVVSKEEGRIPSSIELFGDLEEIRSKVDRYQSRKDLDKFPEVKAAGEAVASCYRVNKSTPLDCWMEVARFKESIAQVEKSAIPMGNPDESEDTAVNSDRVLA